MQYGTSFQLHDGAAAKHPRGRPPYKRPRATKPKKKAVQYKKGPLWSRPYDGGPLHPELDAVLAMPFLASIHISPLAGGMTYPINDGTGRLAQMSGLHDRMRHRFFHGSKGASKNVDKLGKSSSKAKGSHAEACLEAAIRTGSPPRNDDSPYAFAVWRHWERNHHRPVLAQLPVVLTDTMCITAGDFFTLHTDPATQRVTLWLWELKTGYKANTKARKKMAAPLEHVPLTPKNRFQLQVLLTGIAYEKELRMKIDGGCRVIHAWEVPGSNECEVEVLEPAQLEPPNWTQQVDRDALYAALKAPEKRERKKKKKKKKAVPKKKLKI